MTDHSGRTPRFAEDLLARTVLVGAVAGGLAGLALMLPEIIRVAQGIPVEDLDRGLWVAAVLVGAVIGAGCGVVGGAGWLMAQTRLQHRPTVCRVIGALAAALLLVVLSVTWSPELFVPAAVTAALIAYLATPRVAYRRDPRPTPTEDVAAVVGV